MNFFLGTHMPHWLATAGVPLFVSRRRLAGYRRLPRAIAPWALDSGGFTELTLHGRWTVPAATYAREVARMEWAAPQDWMCEPVIIAQTGLSVREHQARTIASVLELRALGAPVIPVLQGWGIGEYFHHVEAYDRAGLDLRAEPVVGLGTVCRRQHTTTAAILVHQLAREGLRLHGFGFKVTGLRAVAGDLVSSDSLAWSYAARREAPRPTCVGRHINCANCQPYALEWREALLDSLDSQAQQGVLCA